MMYGFIFRTEEEWFDWCDYIGEIAKMYGLNLAEKTAREFEQQFYDHRAARFAIGDLRLSSVFDDRATHKSALYNGIREATRDAIVTRHFIVERVA